MLQTTIGRITLKNPVISASGLWNDYLPYLIDCSMLGGVVTRTIRFSSTYNDYPRYLQIDECTYNAVGMPCFSDDNFYHNLPPHHINHDGKTPYIFSISAVSTKQFIDTARAICRPSSENVWNEAQISGFELNISSPNLKDKWLKHPKDVQELVCSFVEHNDHPLWVKLPASFELALPLAEAAQYGGAQAVVSSNSHSGLVIDISKRQLALFSKQKDNGCVGVSSPSFKALNLLNVKKLCNVLTIPVIGCGGVKDYRDVLCYLMCGASAVQVGSISLTKPDAMLKIVADLNEYCVKNDISSISSVIGCIE